MIRSQIVSEVHPSRYRTFPSAVRWRFIFIKIRPVAWPPGLYITLGMAIIIGQKSAKFCIFFTLYAQMVFSLHVNQIKKYILTPMHVQTNTRPYKCTFTWWFFMLQQRLCKKYNGGAYRTTSSRENVRRDLSQTFTGGCGAGFAFALDPGLVKTPRSKSR